MNSLSSLQVAASHVGLNNVKRHKQRNCDGSSFVSLRLACVNSDSEKMLYRQTQPNEFIQYLGWVKF